MSNSDRGNEPATLGIFGAISSLVLCCFIVGILAFSNGQETERRNKAPAAYSEAAKNKAQQDCAGRELNAAFECIYEKVEASQQQAHDEQDLTAQQKSANGTIITAALAFVGLIVSVVGISLVYTTFNETREANDIARDSNRPWIRIEYEIVEDFRWHRIGGGKINIRVKAFNDGQSPARNVVFRSKFALGPWGLDEKTFFQDQIRETVQSVRNNASGRTIFPTKTIEETLTPEFSETEVKSVHIRQNEIRGERQTEDIMINPVLYIGCGYIPLGNSAPKITAYLCKLVIIGPTGFGWIHEKTLYEKSKITMHCQGENSAHID